MSKTIYVGGLSFEMSEFELRELFASAGSVHEVNLVPDEITGKPQGFAFITMATDGEAESAISRLHGHMVNGKPIVVGEAFLPKERSSARMAPVISNK